MKHGGNVSLLVTIRKTVQKNIRKIETIVLQLPA